MKKTTLFSTCIFIFIYILMTSHVQSAPQGLETCSFRGSPDKYLAQTPDFNVSEADLYLFCVLTQFVDPTLVTEWETLSGQDLIQLKKALDLYITSQYYAREAEPITTAREVEISTLAKRITTYGAARFLWADQVIRDQIVMFPEDVAYYLNLHHDEFSTEEYLELRWIRVAVAATATREEKEAALERAKTVRKEAVELGGLLPIMEKYPDLLMGPSDQIKKVTRTDKDLDPLIVNEAYKMEEGQISLPTRTQVGYVLFEIINHVEATPLDLGTAYPLVKQELAAQFLPQQYDYNLNKAITNSHTINRSHLYNYVPGDAVIIQVRDFKLDKDQFQTLFPELTTLAPTPSLLPIAAMSQNIESGEVILQELEEMAATIANPFFDKAREMSESLYLASKYQRAKRQQMDVSEEAIIDWLASNREQLLPGTSKETWRIDIYPKQGEILTKTEKTALKGVMVDEMNLVLEKIRRRLKEQQEVSGDNTSYTPERFLRNLPTPSDRRLMIGYTAMGPVTEKQAQEDLGITFEALKTGTFTAPSTLRDGTVVSYYTAKEIKQADPSEEQLMSMAKNKLLNELATKDVQQAIAKLAEEGNLTFATPLDQAPNHF